MGKLFIATVFLAASTSLFMIAYTVEKSRFSIHHWKNIIQNALSSSVLIPVASFSLYLGIISGKISKRFILCGFSLCLLLLWIHTNPKSARRFLFAVGGTYIFLAIWISLAYIGTFDTEIASEPMFPVFFFACG